MIPMTALNVLRLMSFLTSSNNPLTYFIDSMSHTRQSASALAAKVETLLKLADLRGNRTPTLAYFVMPLSYLLSHSSSILPFASPPLFFLLFFQSPQLYLERGGSSSRINAATEDCAGSTSPAGSKPRGALPLLAEN